MSMHYEPVKYNVELSIDEIKLIAHVLDYAECYSSDLGCIKHLQDEFAELLMWIR